MLPLSLIDDAVIEENESVALKLKTDNKAARVGEKDTCTLTIVDNDVPAANFLVEEVSVAEAAGSEAVTLQLTHPANLITPANYSTGVSPAVTFDWSDARYAVRYDLYLWKQGEAMPSAPTAANLTASTYKPAKPLSAATDYVWRAIAENQYADIGTVYGYFKTK